MNYFEKVKQQKTKSNLPKLLIFGMDRYVFIETNRSLTVGKIYMFICDFFDLVNDWLRDQYGIHNFLGGEVNIQTGIILTEMEKELFSRYKSRAGKHNAINSTIILGLIPYIKQCESNQVKEFYQTCKEVNDFLKYSQDFTGLVINDDLQNEILQKEFDLKKEIA